MPGRIAIDSNIAIALLKGENSVKKHLEVFENIYLPIPVAGELIFGALKSKKTAENLKRCLALINKTQLIPCDYPVSEQYAGIRINLQQRGTPIPENDIWIAACCIHLEVPLATRDAHFEKIADFKIMKW